MTIPPVPHEVFLQHVNSLRALARGLLGDDDAAEDVLQDAWLTARVRAPHRVERAGAWLRTVVRSMALRRLRGEGRRAAREALVASGGEDEAANDLVLRKALLRRVVDHLFALDEPYQTVLFLRYFEGLPPRTIARRLGRTDATVRSQLHRGLERLRGLLDDESPGGRDAWAVALLPVAGLRELPLPAPAPETAGGLVPKSAGVTPGANPLGGLVMGWTVKLAITLTLALSLGVAVWGPGAQEDGVASSARSRVDAREPAPVADVRAPAADVAQAARTEASQRREVAPAEGARREPASLPLADEQTALFLWARDELGLPVEDALVFLGPIGGTLNHVGETDARGTFDLAWAAHLSPTEMVFAVRRDQARWSGLRAFQARTGTVHVAEVALPTAVVRAGLELPDQLAGIEGMLTQAVLRVAEEETSGGWLGGVPQLDRDTFETPWFRSDVYRSDTALFQLRVMDALENVMVTRQYQTNKDGVLIEEVVVPLPDPWPPEEMEVALLTEVVAFEDALAAMAQEPETCVAGRVLDGDGRPAAGVPVTLLTDGAVFVTVATDEEGQFRITGRIAGERELRAGGGRHGIATTALALELGDEVWRDLVLDRGAPVRGTLRDADGRPLAGWTVELSRTGPYPRAALATADEQGRFELPNVRSLAHRLFVRGPQGIGSVPALVVGDVRPGDALELVVPAPGASVAVDLVDHGGEPVCAAEVRLLHEDSGHGVTLEGDGVGGYAAADLPSGAYRAWVGAGPLGWRDLGRLWLGAAEEASLGAVRFDAPATIAWSTGLGEAYPDASQTLRLLENDAPVPTLVLHETLSGDGEVQVPAGAYVLELVSQAGARQVHAVELLPGGRAAVALEGVLEGDGEVPAAVLVQGLMKDGVLIEQVEVPLPDPWPPEEIEIVTEMGD